jgi:hypothetical protein
MNATMNSTMKSEQIDLVRRPFDAMWSVRRKLADQFCDIGDVLDR